jgi:ketosteroid isomerase-like protein
MPEQSDDLAAPSGVARTDRDLLRAAFEAWNEHGVAAMEPFLTRDVQWHDAPELPGGGVHRGLAETIKWARGWEAGSGEVGVSLYIEEILGDGGDYVSAVRVRLTGGESGVSVPEHYWFFATHLRDGKVSEVRVFLNREQALEVAGVEP